MNHLAHLYLAEGHPGWLCGALLGDVVKGRLAEDDLSGITVQLTPLPIRIRLPPGAGNGSGRNTGATAPS